MAQSSILGGQRAPQQPKGFDTGSLGPSDSSDSGSDVQGEQPSVDTADAETRESAVTVDLGSDSDASGTGERGAAVSDGSRDSADIAPDSTSELLDDPLDDDDMPDPDVRAADRTGKGSR